MATRSERAPVAAEDFLAVVRVHADRVHDAVRRLGCSPAAAVEVVETSALDLAAVASESSRGAGDLVGWWFARARALGRRVADDAGDLPVGGGLLASDIDQQLIAEALDVLPERERVALLLRDSYDLPAGSVAAALGTDADAAMDVVGRARLAFLPELDELDLPSLAGHDVAFGPLARLAVSGPMEARDATPRRHAQSCSVCGAVLDAQVRARLLLAGISVVALPDQERVAMLARVEDRARSLLPSAASLAIEQEARLLELDEEDLGPRRILTPLTGIAALLLAAGAGLGIGLLLSRDAAPTPPGQVIRALPPVTAPPAPTLSPRPSPTPMPTPTAFPSGAVFTVTPSPVATTASASPTAPAEPTATPLDALGITIDPSSGPNGATLTVQGAGWVPGRQVQVTYLDTFGRATGSQASTAADARGRFTLQLAAFDPARVPGRHEVRAANGVQQRSASYDAQG